MNVSKELREFELEFGVTCHCTHIKCVKPAIKFVPTTDGRYAVCGQHSGER